MPHPRVYLPSAWRRLLAIPDFSRRRTPVGKTIAHPDNEVAHLHDPTPYRDDFRELATQVGPYVVVALLMSGSSNYSYGRLMPA